MKSNKSVMAKLLNKNALSPKAVPAPAAGKPITVPKGEMRDSSGKKKKK